MENLKMGEVLNTMSKFVQNTEFAASHIANLANQILVKSDDEEIKHIAQSILQSAKEMENSVR